MFLNKMRAIKLVFAPVTMEPEAGGVCRWRARTDLQLIILSLFRLPSGGIKMAFCAEMLTHLSCGVKLTAVPHGPAQVISQRATCCYRIHNLGL